MKFEFLSSMLCDHFHTQFAANEKIIFSLKRNGKVPGYVFDGMTSDVNGNLFITTFGGHKVVKIDPKYVIRMSIVGFLLIKILFI